MDSVEHEIDAAGNGLLIKINASKFDASTCGDFNRYVDRVVHEKWASITLDLSSVTFIDSSGIGALLAVQKSWRHSNESITIRGATPTVKSVIELLRLQRVFTIQEA